MLFEREDDERRSCPDCGRVYLRTLTNGDVPYMYRDENLYSFQKLPDRVAPRGRPPPATQPPPPAPATSAVRVGRCPRCGSTDVAQDTWEVQDDEVRLTCRACRHHEVVDYPARPGWFVFIELPTVNRVLPPFVPLECEPEATAPVPPEPAKTTPPPALVPAVGSPPQGCSQCLGADAETAWVSVTGRSTHSLVNEPHFVVRATRCRCGEAFVVVFTERVDYRDGEDSQVEVAVAVRPEELAALTSQRDSVGAPLTRFARGRRFLVKAAPGAPQWLAQGFGIGPHD